MQCGHVMILSNDSTMATLSGPSDLWFGVGFNAQQMQVLTVCLEWYHVWSGTKSLHKHIAITF